MAEREVWPERMSEPGALVGGAPFALGVALLVAGALAGVSRWPACVVDWPRAVIAAMVLISAVAAGALVRLDPPGFGLAIDPSTEPLLPAGDPGQALYREAIRDFGDDEVYVVAIECDEVFTVECLSAMQRVANPIARLPQVRSVGSLLDVTSFRYVEEEDWIEVRPFIEEIPSATAELEELRRRALADPVYRRTLVAEDARSAALNISFRSMTDAELIASGLDGTIRGILGEGLGSDGNGHRFYVSGRPHFKTHVYHGMLGDLRLLIPLSIAVVGGVLWAMTGARRGVVLPLATALAAVLWTFGAMAFLGSALTLLTGLLAPMILAIGSLYGVHVLSRYEEEALASPDGRTAALRCLQHTIVPVAIAGLTTVVGFAALLITDVPAVFELGAYSMLAMASITLISLTGTPAILAVLPLRAGAGTEAEKPRPALSRWIDRGLERLLRSLASFVSRRRTAILWSAGLASLVAALAVPRIVIDTDYLSYFDESDPVRIDFEAVNRLLAGAIPLYVVFDGPEAGAFREPVALEAVEEIQRRLEQVAGVSRTLSFVDTLRVLNRAFAAGDPVQERIPDTRLAVAELLFMIPKTDLKRFATVDHARANVIARTGEVGSAAIRRITADMQAVIDDVPLPEGVQARITGNSLLLARSADGIATGQPRSVALAAIAIFLLIALGLRSPRLGAVAMIPNLIPVLVYFGILGLGAAPLSLPTSLIGCVALGIAIDDTVHFLVRYRAERALGATPEEAAARCSRFVGRPIVITSAMLCAGFLVIAFSEFATLQEFGILSAVTMAVCLLTDLVLLPALLLRLRV